MIDTVEFTVTLTLVEFSTKLCERKIGYEKTCLACVDASCYNKTVFYIKRSSLLTLQEEIKLIKV